MPVKWEIKVSLLWIICTIAVTIILLIKPFSCDLKRSQHSPGLALWRNLLGDYGHIRATSVSDPITDPIEIPDEIITSTTTGSGYWVPKTDYTTGDTVDVDVSVVVLEDESAWVKVQIENTIAKWHKIESYIRPNKPIVRNWSIFAEAVNCKSSPIGIGIAYRIWRPLEINVSPAISVSTQLEWVAGEVRLSRNIWSGMAIGGGIGWRMRMSQDILTGELQLTGGVSLEL